MIFSAPRIGPLQQICIPHDRSSEISAGLCVLSDDMYTLHPDFLLRVRVPDVLLSALCTLSPKLSALNPYTLNP